MPNKLNKEAKVDYNSMKENFT